MSLFRKKNGMVKFLGDVEMEASKQKVFLLAKEQEKLAQQLLNKAAELRRELESGR